MGNIFEENLARSLNNFGWLISFFNATVLLDLRVQQKKTYFPHQMCKQGLTWLFTESG